MQYAELHCLTNFSFLEAASHPEELVVRAAELGYSALAITDSNSLAGVVRANTAAKDHSLKLIIGSEIRPMDAPPRGALGKRSQWLWQSLSFDYARATASRQRRMSNQPGGHRRLLHGLVGGIVPPPWCEQLVGG